MLEVKIFLGLLMTPTNPCPLSKICVDNMHHDSKSCFLHLRLVKSKFLMDLLLYCLPHKFLSLVSWSHFVRGNLGHPWILTCLYFPIPKYVKSICIRVEPKISVWDPDFNIKSTGCKLTSYEDYWLNFSYELNFMFFIYI